MDTAKKRSAWRYLWIPAAIVIAIPVLAVLAILSLRLSGVQSYVLAQVKGELEAAGVEIGSVSGAWPDEIIAEKVTVADAQGIWLSAERARVLWSPWSALGATANIQLLEVNGVVMLREPVSEPSATPDEPLAWPSLPVALDIARFTGDGVLAAAVTGEDVALSFEGAGKLNGSAAEIDLTARQNTGELAVTLKGSTSSDLQSLRLVMDARDPRIAAAFAKDESLRDLAVRTDLTREGDTWTGGFFVETAGYGAVDGAFVQDGFIRLHIPETKPLGVKFDAPVSGAFETLVRILALDEEGNVSLELFADTSKLKSSDELIAKLVQDGRVSGRVDVTSDGSVSFADLNGTLAANRVLIGGRGKLGSDNAIDADLTTQVSDISVFTAEAGGSANVHTIITGPTSAPAFTIDLTGANIRQGSLSWSQVQGQAQVDAAGLGQASLQAQGAVPIALTALMQKDGEVRTVDVSGTALGADVKALARLEEKGPTGTARIVAPSLAPIGQFVGVPLTGAATVESSFTAGEKAVTIDAKVTGKQVTYETISIATLDATAKGPTTELEFEARAAGTSGGQPLKLDTTGVFSSEAERLRLNRLKVTQGEIDAALAKPVDIAIGETLELPKTQIQLTRKGKLAGTILVSGKQNAAGLIVDLNAQGMDLRAISDGELGGTANVTAAFDGGKGTLTATAETKRMRVRASDARVAPPLDLTVKANWREGQLVVDGTGVAKNMAPATFRLATKMARAPDGGVPDLPPGAPIDGKLTWNGRIGPVFSALDMPGHTLDGDSDINITISGTVGEPKLQGLAAIKNGTYENELTGTTLTEVALNLDAQGTSAHVVIDAKDGGRGSLKGDMTVDITRGIGSAGGQLTVANALLVKRDDVTARLTGELRVVSAVEGGPLRLQGKMTATDVAGRIPKSLPPSVVVVDVVDPAAPPPAPVEKGTAPNDSVPIELDLTVDIPGPASVSGRGLQSLWKGNLAVKGVVSAPEISGRMEALRGGLDLAGQRLELKSGVITFDSGAKVDPRIDIVFEGKSEDVQSEIALTGRASSLKVEARSTPPLPADEVLARALFGKPSAELTAGEALQLVRSIAELSGQTGGGPDLVSELQGQLGVDVLRVEGLTDDAGPTVTAGKYVSSNVYVGVKQGAKPGSTAATVEIEITDELSLETDVGADASSSVGANWSHDY